MVVAGLRSEEASGTDLAALITGEPIAELLKKARSSRPVPAPDELEFDIGCDPPNRPAHVDPALIANALQHERLELSGPEIVFRAAALCGSLPSDRNWSCSLNTQDGRAVVECKCDILSTTVPRKSVESPPSKRHLGDDNRLQPRRVETLPGPRPAPLDDPPEPSFDHHFRRAYCWLASWPRQKVTQWIVVFLLGFSLGWLAGRAWERPIQTPPNAGGDSLPPSTTVPISKPSTRGEEQIPLVPAPRLEGRRLPGLKPSVLKTL